MNEGIFTSPVTAVLQAQLNSKSDGGGRHEGLESAQREIDKLTAERTRLTNLAFERYTEINKLTSRNVSARDEINYLQTRLHDYRCNYGPAARSFDTDHPAYYSGKQAYYHAGSGQSFPYNASRATLEVTRSYFEMLQSNIRNANELQLRVNSFESFKSAIREALGVKGGEDTVGIAKIVKKSAEYNFKQNELINELQAKSKRLTQEVIDKQVALCASQKRNDALQKINDSLKQRSDWQTNEINKHWSVVPEQQPAYLRLKAENESLRGTCANAAQYLSQRSGSPKASV